MFISCRSENYQIDSPLATVVKLICAESFADFDEAKKYIDVEKVYSGYSDTLSPEQMWKSQVVFFYNMGKDKKFTERFKYFNYVIKEGQIGDSAEIIFESIRPEESIRKITYRLSRCNDKWIVIKIDYVKR
ncbi:MAG: hypothetical protein QM731_03930 [Chitinophagaceae bacterium]